MLLPQIQLLFPSLNAWEPVGHETPTKSHIVPSREASHVTEWIVTGSFVVVLWTIETNMKITFWVFMWNNLILELINKIRVVWFNKRSPYVYTLLPKTWWIPETWQTSCALPDFHVADRMGECIFFRNTPVAFGRWLGNWHSSRK